MTDTEKRAEDFLRASLTFARNRAAREVSFTDEGVSFVDFFGKRYSMEVVDAAAVVNPGEIKGILDGNKFRVHDYWKARENERHIAGYGRFYFNEADDGLILKPKKPFPPCIEAVVADYDEEELAKFRSLYREGGIDVLVCCEGEPRTRQLVLAMAAERYIAGLPTEASVHPERDYRYSTVEQQEGPSVYWNDHWETGELWNIRQADQNGTANLFVHPNSCPETIVLVDSGRNYDARRALRADLGMRKRPTVVVGIWLEDSRPKMKISFSPSLESKLSTKSTVWDAPWERFVKARKEREAKRPKAPVTWHPTTAAVARAFVAREAPRGYVSGKSIYFHGPVAYSVYDGNPIAAFVDFPDGKTAVFFGRDSGIGGSLAGTVSSAQCDIKEAIRGSGFLEFHVGRLTEFLTLKDLDLENAPFKFRRDKNESDYPSSCRIDKRKLGRWIKDRHASCQERLERALETKFATFAKAQAWHSFQVLAEMRDDLSACLGYSLPDVGDASWYRVKAEEAGNDARARQEELIRRKTESGQGIGRRM